MTQPKDVQSYLISSINNHFLSIAAIVVVVFVMAEFVVLATVGTKGAEIAQIRQEMDQLRIENEHIRAEIDKAKTTSRISHGLKSRFDLEGKEINTLHVSSDELSLGSISIGN